MKFILGKDRNQTEIICLEQLISDKNDVRLIDLFHSVTIFQDFKTKSKIKSFITQNSTSIF